MNFTELSEKVHQNAIEKGWWEGEERNVGELIALMHSELSEALEEARKGVPVADVYFPESQKCTWCGTTHLNLSDGKPGICPNCDIKNLPKPEGVPVELADCMIRILDFCGAYRIDIEKVVMQKIEFNETRQRKHGKEF